ncbi:MAG TPA: tetratricopeptide repeat protein, partial [Syntrophales bacterium]|nr:tetratricopeptide repeat protein [Syntrophales bacterium]
ILLELGKAYLASGRTSDAITLLRRSYELDDQDNETLLYLGRAYEEAGSYSTALEFYRQYSSKNPKDVNIFYNMAMAYGKTGNNARSHYYFALYFKNKNKVESALFHLKEAQKYGDPELKAEIEKEIELLRPPKKK